MPWLPLLSSLAPALPAQAADHAREKKWADGLLPAVLLGEPVWLQDGRHTFLGLYTPATNARATIIVVHGLEVHPDWGLISALRQQLPEAGYSTLSVQMPVLQATAKGADYPPTFPAAARHLKEALGYPQGKGHAKLSIVSHGLGCRMSYAYLSSKRDDDIHAWVAVGAPGSDDWSALALPILDLYAANDLPQVLKNAPTRAKGLKQPGSAQVKVGGSGSFLRRHGRGPAAAGERVPGRDAVRQEVWRGSRLRGLLPCALALMAEVAWAGAYKCMAQGETTIYQDRPCASGGAVDLGPNSRPPLDADRDAARLRRESDLAAVAALRQAAERAEALERERQRTQAERTARAEEAARRRQEACQAEAARLKVLATRVAGGWKGRHDYAERQRKYREKCAPR